MSLWIVSSMKKKPPWEEGGSGFHNTLADDRDGERGKAEQDSGNNPLLVTLPDAAATRAMPTMLTKTMKRMFTCLPSPNRQMSPRLHRRRYRWPCADRGTPARHRARTCRAWAARYGPVVRRPWGGDGG